jgi:pSer/pThr/pTyr-binding forkhead associated (FHA) protein
MPKLTLKFKEKSLEDYQLQKGFSLTIGRQKNNDVIIDNLAVSGHHAKIDSVADGFVLVDLQSKNGSFVNERLISSHWLKNGDVINIGKHSLVFRYSEDEEQPANDGDKIERTMVMDTSQYRTMVKKSKPKPQKSPAKHESTKATARLSYLAGGSGKINLSGKIVKIGKHASSDIVVKGLLVGRTSATICQRPDGFYLSRVGGLSKPRLNEKIVKQSVILNDLDIIDVGSTKLQFHKNARPKKQRKPKT